jgi:uncharacterized membrane protein
MIKAVKKWRVIAATTISSLAVVWVAHAQAQSQTIKLTDPLGGKETFPSVAVAVAGFLFWDIAVPLSVIMVLVGAFKLITSSGDPEKVSEGRKTILYAAVGLAVALVAGGIVSIIKSLLGVS